MKKVICIGSSAKDIFFPTSEGLVMETKEDVASQRKIAFELGAKYHIEDRFESLGGCAVNVACGLRRLGIEVSCYTFLGNDMVGAWIEKEVEKEGIDTSLIFRVECLTGLSAIIVDEKSGERIIFSNQESAEKMEIHPEKIGDAEWISATDLSGDWKKSLGVIFSVADKNKIKVSFNPRGKNIQEDAKMVYDFCGKSEICFINKDEAIEILLKNSQGKISDENINDEIFLLKELKKSGVGLMVITDGERGAWVMKDEKIVYAKSLKEKAVDSTGTGDAFSSGFLAAYIKEKPLEECIRWGISNGGSVVNFYGAIDGLLNEEKIEEKAKSVETKEI